MNFEITYNSYEIGGSSTAAFPIGGLSWEETNSTLSLSLDFVLVASSVANYASAEDTMVAALGESEAAFTVANGATTMFSGNPATKTAFNIEAAARRVPDPDIDTPLCKRWRFTLACNLPPKKSGDSNRIAYSVTVARSPSKLRQVTIAGVWSAGGGNGARTNLDAGFATLASSVLTGLGGNYDLVAQGPEQEDHRQGLCSFVSTYAERNYTTSVSGLINQQVRFTQTRGVLDTPTRRSVTIEFSANVDKTVVSESSLPATLASARAVLLAKAISLYSADVGYLENKIENVDSTGSTITASYMVVLAATGFPHRRNASVQLSFSPARQMSVFLSGAYHHDGSDDAKANYEADIATWATAVLDDIDDADNFDLISEAPLTYDDDKQEFQFARLYRERLATTADTGILSESFSFSRTQTLMSASNDPGAVRGVIQGTAYYNKDTVSPSAIASQYRSSLREKLLTSMTAQWGSVIVEQEDVQVNPHTGSITVLLRVLLPGNALDLSRNVEVAYSIDSRVVFRDVYDGNFISATAWTPGPAYFAVVTETVLTLSGSRPLISSHRPLLEQILPSGEWVFIGSPGVSERQWNLGVAPPDTTAGTTAVMREYNVTSTWRFVNLKPVPPIPPMERIVVREVKSSLS